MGGSVFTKGVHRLYVPRMVPSVYKHVHSQLVTALRPLFPRIDKPIEAAEKHTYGDIDLLVSLEGSAFRDKQTKGPMFADAWAALDKALAPMQTHQTIAQWNSKHLAIAWPKGLTPDEMKSQLAEEARHLARQKAAKAEEKEKQEKQEAEEAAKKAAKESGVEDKAVPAEKAGTAEMTKSSPHPDPSAGTPADENATIAELARLDRYVQVDIHMCGTDQELEWQKFKNSHGGLWFTLGSSMRPLGLLLGNDGLYLNIWDHDARVSKNTRMLLTNNPTRVLDFLGLSHANGEWTKPFETVKDAAKYISTYRWYVKRPPLSKEERRNKSPGFLKYMDADQALSSSKVMGDLTQELAKVRHLAFSSFPGTEKTYADLIAGWELESFKRKWTDDVKTTIDRDFCLPRKLALKEIPSSRHTRDPRHTEQVWRHILRLALRRLLLSKAGDRYELGSVKPPKFDSTTPISTVQNWIRDNYLEVGREAWDLVEKQLDREPELVNTILGDPKSSQAQAAAADAPKTQEVPGEKHADDPAFFQMVRLQPTQDGVERVVINPHWSQSGKYTTKRLVLSRAQGSGDSKTVAPKEEGASRKAAAASASDAPQSGDQS